VRDGVPRLTLDAEQSGADHSPGSNVDDSDAPAIQASFDWEWEHFAYSDRTWGWTVQERRDLFLKEVGVEPQDLVGRVVLDAGCGNGSLSRALNDFGCEVVAADVSTSVVAAYRHFAALGNNRTHFVQLDLLHPPLRGEAFDVVYSSGVLHHTPSTRRALDAVAASLAPGGRIYIWLYWMVPGLRHQLKQRFRRAVVRLPASLKHGVMRALLGQSLARRHLRRLLGSTMPQDDISRGELWVLLLDQYTPRYRWEHTPEEVHAWYRDLGLSDIAMTEEREWGFGVAGRKPTEPGLP
jgi:SAM-dependent methyltransferase